MSRVDANTFWVNTAVDDTIGIVQYTASGTPIGNVESVYRLRPSNGAYQVASSFPWL